MNVSKNCDYMQILYYSIYYLDAFKSNKQSPLRRLHPASIQYHPSTITSPWPSLCMIIIVVTCIA